MKTQIVKLIELARKWHDFHVKYSFGSTYHYSEDGKDNVYVGLQQDEVYYVAFGYNAFELYHYNKGNERFSIKIDGFNEDSLSDLFKTYSFMLDYFVENKSADMKAESERKKSERISELQEELKRLEASDVS